MSGRVRLAIDYGGTTTQAVVAWPDGRWTPVTVDGSVVLSSAVLVAADASVWTGEQAWRAAVREPDRFVPAPRRSAEQDIDVDGRRVPAADLVAATLRRIAEQAQLVAGGPVEDVRLVVPAGWGPRRRTWMRQAAHRAGLGQPRLVEAPVAVADHLLAHGTQLPVGAYLLVVDVGGGAEVTVLRRGPAGFEVLATLADPAAGGDAIDHALAAALPGEDGGWGWVASVRTAKENLAWHTAITVPQPGGTAVVATGVLLEETARPVLERVGQLTVDTIAAAELTPADLAGVCLVGGTTRLPLAAAVVAQRTGLTPHVIDDPLFAAARGAADTTADDGEGVGQEPVMPPARRAWAVAVPGFMSLAMIVQMLLTVYWGGIYPNSWAEPSWGQLAMASVFAVIACLSAGTLLGSLAATHGTPAGQAAPPGRAPAVSLGILSAMSLGTAIAALYAVVAAQYLQMQIGPFLRWALLPILPVAVLALAAAVVAARQWRTPPGGWSALLLFPVGSVLAAGTGMGLVQYSATADRWPDMVLWIDLAGRAGGLLIGVGAVTALTRPWILRLVIGAPLAVITAAIASPNTIGILAGIYATAVTTWWIYRLWTRLVRTPTAAHAPQP
ncbi:Hsp70 family protein [Micromonospora yangpuensis]|uniref:Hsp70 protein n=1 Tax=Micromonospora yangpuensis TaxID=683228 RepID=A0A1C6U463_9ACTN|nr:Hsp70 family protein [Micromonospora yangpuensis]GGL92873.1 hypothetical protein GCM10012279_08160 [Micromonospora yangpuensis]SCL48860.1 Hsp70 protein [Micromonospora yangpuensis]